MKKTAFLIASLFPILSHAGGVDKLKAFYENTNAMRADFKQTVVDAQGRKVQEVSGTMQLQRPGKFRWDYYKPYVQQIVGDGEKVWLYDPDLNQVTVRELGKTLGSSPAALLAGSRDVEKTFNLKDESRQEDSLEWVEASAKDKESGFEKVYLGFKGDALQEMELHDSFGHITVIEFSKFQRNPKLDSKAFRFITPKGADVVGE
jgi:outer membrane lipoprotein carrier protein